MSASSCFGAARKRRPRGNTKVAAWAAHQKSFRIGKALRTTKPANASQTDSRTPKPTQYQPPVFPKEAK